MGEQAKGRGKSFNGRRAQSQRAIVKLLEDSPLPWTRSMLFHWFGMDPGRGWAPFYGAPGGRRIIQVDHLIYTAASKAPYGRVVIVTDAMVTRYTGYPL